MSNRAALFWIALIALATGLAYAFGDHSPPPIQGRLGTLDRKLLRVPRKVNAGAADARRPQVVGGGFAFAFFGQAPRIAALFQLRDGVI